MKNMYYDIESKLKNNLYQLNFAQKVRVAQETYKFTTHLEIWVKIYRGLI